MNIKGLTSIIAALILTACLPETEISSKNAESILAATAVSNQINETIKVGVGSQASLAKSLSRMSVRTLGNFNVVDDCQTSGKYQFTGQYDDIQDGVTGDYFLALSQCETPKGLVEGVIGGSFIALISTGALDIEYSAKGDVDFKAGKQTIKVADYSADARYSSKAGLDDTIYYKHGGKYNYDTHQYKGTITAQTVTEIEWRLINGQLSAVQGVVNYTDSAGNVLRVAYNANGVSTYLNTVLLKTYSHADWLNKF
ncbi:hypothetical protein [Reinekea sp.]|uniref:hypothetical protein n=1 Tax=Reinekea sp. TaxID=1970455 RepID=UPI00398A4FA6